MKLTQIELRTKFQHKAEQEFNKESWSIPEFYWSFLKNYNTDKTKKCVIRLDSDWGETVNKITDQANVVQINMNFDFDSYFKSSDNIKKVLQLKVLHTGMMKIAEVKGWDIDSILDAYNKVVKNDLKYEFLVSEKIKASPNKKYYINFWCEWDISYCKLYWVLYDKQKKEIARKLIIEKDSFLGEFVYYIKYKWLDNENIVLENKHRCDEVFNINLNKYLTK